MGRGGLKASLTAQGDDARLRGADEVVQVAQLHGAGEPRHDDGPRAARARAGNHESGEKRSAERVGEGKEFGESCWHYSYKPSDSFEVLTRTSTRICKVDE